MLITDFRSVGTDRRELWPHGACAGNPKKPAKARIDGCLAPFTFMRNDEAEIVAQVKRDCEAAKAAGRGLNISTAESINNGSLLSSIRLVLAAIQKYGRY